MEDDWLERTYTLVGTPHYIAPEVLRQAGYDYSCDYWGLGNFYLTKGILMFELICGYLPFAGDEGDPLKVYESIQRDELEFPDDMEDEEARDLISSLLIKSPEARLSGGKMPGVMAHKFFYKMDWNALLLRKIQPPFLPNLENILLKSPANSTLMDEVANATEELLEEEDDSHYYRNAKCDLNIKELDNYF